MKGKLAGRVEHDARLGRVVKSKKGGEEICSFELSGKEISLIMMKRNRKRKRTKTGEKRRHIAGRAYDTGRGGSKAASKCN